MCVQGEAHVFRIISANAQRNIRELNVTLQFALEHLVHLRLSVHPMVFALHQIPVTAPMAGQETHAILRLVLVSYRVIPQCVLGTEIALLPMRVRVTMVGQETNAKLRLVTGSQPHPLRFAPHEVLAVHQISVVVRLAILAKCVSSQFAMVYHQTFPHAVQDMVFALNQILVRVEQVGLERNVKSQFVTMYLQLMCRSVALTVIVRRPTAVIVLEVGHDRIVMLPFVSQYYQQTLQFVLDTVHVLDPILVNVNLDGVETIVLLHLAHVCMVLV